MPVDEQDLRSLSKVRFLHARDCLHEAKALLSKEKFKGAANRSYYAVSLVDYALPPMLGLHSVVDYIVDYAGKAV